MVNWQITAKTIYCDAVKDEVTILVKKDWSVQCTGQQSGTQADKTTGCEGIDCHRVIEYKNALIREENE